MKKLVLTISLVLLMTTPVWAVATLGDWELGDPRTVHVEWSFNTQPVSGGPAGFDFTANPEVYLVEGLPGGGTATAFIGVTEGQWRDGSFYDPQRIDVLLEISNFTGGQEKIIWVDVICDGSLIDLGAIGNVEGGSYPSILLKPLPGSDADFGFRIVPNPDKEDVWFSILAPEGMTAQFPAMLTGIRVDTICYSIPAPGAILLGGIGVAFVGWMRRRRTL